MEWNSVCKDIAHDRYSKNVTSLTPGWEKKWT